MRLRLDLLIGDIAFRFNISDALFSSVFTTWFQFISTELSWLSARSDRNISEQNFSSIFRKYYSRCCIIRLFRTIETPSSLKVGGKCAGQITSTTKLPNIR